MDKRIDLNGQRTSFGFRTERFGFNVEEPKHGLVVHFTIAVERTGDGFYQDSHLEVDFMDIVRVACKELNVSELNRSQNMLYVLYKAGEIGGWKCFTDALSKNLSESQFCELLPQDCVDYLEDMSVFSSEYEGPIEINWADIDWSEEGGVGQNCLVYVDQLLNKVVEYFTEELEKMNGGIGNA